LKREAAALKDAALTLPDDPKRAERVETYERLRDQNATYVTATETRTVAVVNIERERAASANALRIMRSIWRTAPPPPKPPPQAFTNPRLVAFKANANLGLSAVEHAFGEAA
jgi:hypothetical protein